ncbi:C2H2-type zinc finger protein [Raoultella sp. HC6]|uniref:C2H2-type zinc finger protein n=1 Tax=Raoultella sp. HC6 TaxID=2923366 RepID=UPI001F513531|nr:C2H2-type zinc finger protein [Raoultella sp. HC6]
MTTCRICGLTYVPDEPGDQKIHAEEHKKLASGVQPRKVRDFSKAFGWAVAHNDGGIERLKNEDPELGKLVVVYSWWSRALQNGVPTKDFDAYMNAHLAFADSLVSREGEVEARAGIAKWGRYDG